MTATNNNHQQSFFVELSAKFKTKGEMIQTIGQILHVGRDAVYRRLRGETLLSADELISLARKFSISLDPQTKEELPQMHYPDGAVVIESEVQYFRDVLQRSKMMATLPGVEIDYATPELPLFYELYTPTLLAYKTYVYGMTTWNFDKWKGVAFQPELVDPEIEEIADELLEILYKFPARELWSVGILDVTLREIEHGVEVGYLNDEEVIKSMFEELELTIQHMEAMTRAGKRFPPNGTYTNESPDFRVYHNEMTNTNNVIIVKSKVQSIVYTTFVNPNYLFSMDERVLNQMQTWFDNLIESSNVLSASSSKHTITYFNRLRKKVADTKLRIKGLNSLF